MRVCFSYAAYAKNLIDHLKSKNIIVEKGLTDAEVSSIESFLHFTFPSDLRSILQEGLPVGNGFPNWRSSSKQQLEMLINFPILELCKEVSRNNSIWLDCWGVKPDNVDQAVNLAKGFLRKAPVLVKIYQDFYIPARPSMAGNPIFYVHGGEVKLRSFDIAGFYQQFEFRNNDGALRRPTLSKLLNAPPWAATEARRVEFWTEWVDRGERVAPHWWNGELKGCLEGMCGRLRNGGWKEDDVRDMLIMDGCDELDHHDNNMIINKEHVVGHVRLLSKRLIRAGWSTEDVTDSLGKLEEDNQIDGVGDGEPCFEFYDSISC